MKTFLTIGAAFVLLSTAIAQTAERTTYIELNGKTQYLSVDSHTDFDVALGQSYTFTFWLWGESSVIYRDPQRILSRCDTNHTNRSGYEILGLRTTYDSFIGASMPDGAGKFTNSVNGWASAPANTLLRTWHHGALVVDRSSGTIRIYVDGKEMLCKDHDTRSWSAHNTLPLLIGAGLKDGKTIGHFGGRLDNVRLYARALTESEIITDSQTERIDVGTEGLVAAFDFDDYQSGNTTTKDAIGRHIAHLHGFAQKLDHPAVRTYEEKKTNASLIGRSKTQALRTFAIGLDKPEYLDKLTVETPEPTTEKDVHALKLYLTDNGDRFDHRSPGILIAEGRAKVGQTILHRVSKAPRITSRSKLWLVADVRAKATEGNKLTTRIESIRIAGADQTFHPESQSMTHEIVLDRILVWTPTENGSAHYRIPAIVRLSNGHLVAAIDKRKTTDYDLPADIDVEVKISRDNGKSWSAPITVARGTPQHGFGDAAMATDGRNIYMVMVAGSGLWFYPSSAEKPLQMYISQSHDGGRTWTTPREITNEVYTDRYPNGGFFGSGNGIVTSRGRIAFVAALRTDEKWGGTMDNVMVYSDDRGATWHTSPVARHDGDEAKIIELASGELLISSRNRAWKPTPRTYVTSPDHGTTWSKPMVWEDLVGNACNTALARYSLADGKGSKNILLHTLIEAKDRTNLRIYLSEDEGKTWPIGNTICSGEAAYSEICILPDGTIGIISEEDDRPAYDIYFTRVSLNWIRSGGINPNAKP